MKCVLKYEPFLFKLYSSFQYVNSRAEIPARAEISPCNQPLRPHLLFNGKFEYLYIFLSVFATSANLEGQKFSQIRRENSAISLVKIFT